MISVYLNNSYQPINKTILYLFIDDDSKLITIKNHADKDDLPLSNKNLLLNSKNLFYFLAKKRNDGYDLKYQDKLTHLISVSILIETHEPIKSNDNRRSQLISQNNLVLDHSRKRTFPNKLDGDELIL